MKCELHIFFFWIMCNTPFDSKKHPIFLNLTIKFQWIHFSIIFFLNHVIKTYLFFLYYFAGFCCCCWSGSSCCCCGCVWAEGLLLWACFIGIRNPPASMNDNRKRKNHVKTKTKIFTLNKKKKKEIPTNYMKKTKRNGKI